MFKIIAAIGIIQALAIVVNLIRSKVVAVLLGPEGVGIISIVDQVVQFAAQLSVMSLPFASVKFLSRSHSEGFEVFRRDYSGFLKALLILSAVGTVVAIVLVFFRADLLGPQISKYKVILILALLGIPTMVLGGFFGNVLAAAQRFKGSALMGLMTGAVLTISTYLGISLGGILGLYWANVLAGILMTVGGLVYLRKELRLPIYDWGVRISEELRQNPDILPFSFMLYLAASTYSLSFLITRYSVLKNFGEAEAGLLQAAIALALAIGMILTPTNGLFLTPIMNRRIGRDEKIQTAVEFQKKLIVILSVMAMPMVLFPKELLTLLFSPAFAEAGSCVFIFVISQCILQLAGVYQALMIGLDDLKTYALVTCIGYLALCASSWLLVPHFGILGASIGFIVSSSAIFLMTFLPLRLKYGFPMPGGLVSLMGYSLSVMFLVGLIFNKYEAWNIALMLFKASIYVFFVISLLLFFSREERSSLYGLWGRVRLKAMLSFR